MQDLGRDYYHLSGPALEDLGNKVRRGDMEEVLRVYEKELQVSHIRKPHCEHQSANELDRVH